MKVYRPQDVLDAREERVDIQNMILSEFNCPLMVIRINYPGTNKNNELTNGIIKVIEGYIYSLLKSVIKNRRLICGAEGPILIFSVEGTDTELKEAAVRIEETHPLGRLADIDVYNLEGRALSRSDLGFAKRKCYLCEEYAHNCIRASKHDEDIIVKYIKEKYLEYMEKLNEGTIWHK